MKMKPEAAKKMVDKIFKDVSGRKGIGDEMDSYDAASIRDIKRSWLNILMTTEV